ncbi:glycosyl hydrolase family 18 protein [Anaerovorax odorimutans]|uniref:glycosyl hydrolase family 18 protein n=1 Tax=Anaerovorax odorimutans TaxID=109327 RepID=UPI0003FB547C|nr:glycosyl hydrolase family 18 protein [Anaerovorax odorimutans]
MKRKIISILLSISLFAVLIPNTAMAQSSSYNDIPQGNWSVSVINKARDYDLMQGVSDGVFGFGNTITKAEFITVLDRMFGWELITPETASFLDVTNDQWYYTYIETALKNNVIEKTQNFDPNDQITREEMAVMLVRGLGYSTLAQSTSSIGNSFNDVVDNVGYITIASDIGMTKGTSATTFSPKQTAKREEAAAMLVRVYEKYISKIDWVHGFYALSSYSQRELTKNMDGVSVGWSRMSLNNDKEVYLNTTSENNNEWKIPLSYEDIISYFKGNSTKTNLSIYMDTSNVSLSDGSKADLCKTILLDSAKRTQAVNSIVNELTTNYSTIGYNPYSGVTIDFEGMKGSELKEGFNAFLTELSSALKPLGKTIYVTVPPATSDGIYYDAYDYHTIGNIADKVILMAHDYNETTMPENLLGSEYYKNTPVTPFASVYYALKAITDENTGVEDKSKISLAISFDSVGWNIENSKLISTQSVNPIPSTIYTRLKGGAKMGYSDVYRNPYIDYTTEEGKEIFLWYEDERSVGDKLQLAKLFGINGVSLWRIGNIPNYSDGGLYYNVFESIY